MCETKDLVRDLIKCEDVRIAMEAQDEIDRQSVALFGAFNEDGDKSKDKKKVHDTKHASN